MGPINRIGGTMADELRIGLKELLRKAQMEHDADFLKEGLRGSRRRSWRWRSRSRWEQVGAACHERTNIPAAAPLIRYSPIAGARMARPPVLGRFLLGMLRTSSLPGPRGSLPGPSGCRGKSPPQASMANS